MTILEFPPLSEADENGLLAVGGDLEPESLLLAYSSGIFPWPINSKILAWFSPPQRALLFLNEFHVSRSLAKEQKKTCYSFAVDRNFEKVIELCAAAKNRSQQSGAGTWITKEMRRAYLELHRLGFAHSVECYKDGRLIGGLYGVAIGKMFAGESMFHTESNGSKLSLAYLVEHLRKQKVAWIDCQVSTPFLRSMGAREVPRDEFVKLLRTALPGKDCICSTGVGSKG